MDPEKYLHSEITEKIIGAFYKVYNTLGYGFLERVYENAMIIELREMGMEVDPQMPIKVFYKNQEVGYYKSDLIVEKSVLVENKAAEDLCEDHEYQLINYLKASNIEVGLLLNFGKEPSFKRKVFTNKKNHPKSA